jgi:hypothetical protein
MRRSNLAQLGILAAVIALPACSGGGGAVPATASAGPGFTATSVRQRTGSDSVIGYVVHVVPTAAAASPTPGAVTLKTSSVIGYSVHSLIVPSPNPSSSPSPTAVVKTSSVIGYVRHGLIPSNVVSPSPSPSPAAAAAAVVKTSSVIGYSVHAVTTTVAPAASLVATVKTSSVRGLTKHAKPCSVRGLTQEPAKPSRRR